MKHILAVTVFSVGFLLNDLEGKLTMPYNESIPKAGTMISPFNISPKETQEKSTPQIKLHLSQNNGDTLKWGDFVRYTIEVSDKVDGESKYGEISNNSVLLEIELLPVKDEKGSNMNTVSTQTDSIPEGLALMMGSTCFGCHADKEVLTGPSFSEIADRFEKIPNNTVLLASHILEGSSGQWGSMEMPAHPNLTVEETEKIAAFILKQGNRKNHRVVPGLEGSFQVMEKPIGLTQGTLILTASYTSSSSLKGQQRLILPIK
ncbi:MAG: hypothetical protein RIM83_00475 [Allomuricauda sp.]